MLLSSIVGKVKEIDAGQSNGWIKNIENRCFKYYFLEIFVEGIKTNHRFASAKDSFS